MATVETVLRDVQELSPNERHQLRDILNADPTPVSDTIRQLRAKVAQPVHLTPEEIANVRAMLDRASAEIGAAWTSDKSALEAVQEQRRDL